MEVSNLKRIVLLMLMAFSFVFVLAACADDANTTDSDNKKVETNDAGQTTDNKKADSSYADKVTENPIAMITMESGEKIVVELMPKVAPNTVANFISLANSGFYDGVIFHRVIPGFMIQGGDPTGTGSGGPDYSIDGEFAENGFDNKLAHERGVISMARSQAVNSAGSQFFIMVDSAPHLDGQYAAFGQVIEGIEVADKIVAVERDANDKPLEDQKIESIKVDTKGFDYPAPKVNK